MEVLLPGSHENRWLMIGSGILNVSIVRYLFESRGHAVPWWTVFLAAFAFVVWGCVRGVNIGGRDLLFGSATGMLFAMLWMILG